MACNLFALFPLLGSQQPLHLHLHLHLQPRALPAAPISSAAYPFAGLVRRKRGELAVAKAGPPSSTSLILAFVLPLSLLAGTVFTAVRIADRLDEKFLEDLEMNQALMEEREGEDGDEEEGVPLSMDEDGNIVLEKEVAAAAAAAPRVRNRPRREA